MKLRTLKELDNSEGTHQLFQVQNDTSTENPVLIPPPSDDPDDPLRWPSWRKDLAFGTSCLFAMLNNFSGTVLSDSLVPIAQDLGVTIDSTSGLLSWVILTLGLSNFIWVPTANWIGTRPSFLLACSIAFIAALWASLSPTFGSLQAATVVGAFGGGASEALSAAIIKDIYFLHERGEKMGYYIFSIASGSSIGPLCGGYIIQKLGWAWAKWVSTIALGVNLLLFVFLLPETRFARSLQISDPEPKDVEAAAQRPFGTAACSKSYLSMLNPWPGLSKDSYLELLIRPLPLIAYPACLYSTLVSPTVMINVLSSVLLIPPPYNFSIGAVGLLNIPGLSTYLHSKSKPRCILTLRIVGQAIGAVIGGVCMDKWSAYRARRSGGLFTPESRLSLIFIPSAVVFAGIVLFGFAAQQQMHWAVIFVAYGFISLGLTSSVSMSMTYVIDTYFPVAAECLEVINGLKNVVAFGFIHATIPWSSAQGYAKMFGTLAGLFVAITLLTVPLILAGPKIRHHTSARWKLITW
ncbi:major facilitator superfamily domain-containing protein [Talaromyces proteolyticus]|uniref:Major facilitator superfamily domain-containing protein n=1 Tax=Talaromyces proteolyticus TaxID=1131652 RepID=A0AAD4KI18_9EURO|nr:major facilitator superfamily domain-containing protein [Talaromyces proteolyticus]KAH8691667.1 major facilitator superfamily domain-containing protein [Talaromyces proteolyticus]